MMEGLKLRTTLIKVNELFGGLDNGTVILKRDELDFENDSLKAQIFTELSDHFMTINHFCFENGDRIFNVNFLWLQGTCEGIAIRMKTKIKDTEKEQFQKAMSSLIINIMGLNED